MSNSTWCARKAQTVVENAEHIIAGELLTAAQALDMVPVIKASKWGHGPGWYSAAAVTSSALYGWILAACFVALPVLGLCFNRRFQSGTRNGVGLGVVAATLFGILSACARGPIALIPQWDGKPSILSLDGESRLAMTPPFPSELTFRVELPDAPFLDFAVSVLAPSIIGRGRVHLSVRVEDGEESVVVYEEVVRAKEGNHWLDRRVNFAAWRGRDVVLSFAARPETPSAAGAWMEKVQIAWGNPRVLDEAIHVPGTGGRPSVIFVLVDTLRRDYLGAYGFEEGISPNVDWLAKESVIFDNAFSQAPWTKPSIATLFTALYPDIHGLDNHGGLFGERENAFISTGLLSQDAITLAEVFAEHGYRTAAFVANAWLDAEFGFDQGFESYELERDSEALLDHASRWLDANGDEPFFLYLHLMDVHGPYDAPEKDFEWIRNSSSLEVVQSPPLDGLERLPPNLEGISWFSSEDLEPGFRDVVTFRLSRSRTLRARYAANVRDFDRRIGPILRRVRNSDLGERTYVVLTSDHGEELLEHGGWDHGFNLYDHQTHIPLLIRAPGALPSRRRVHQAMNLVDLHAHSHHTRRARGTARRSRP